MWASIPVVGRLRLRDYIRLALAFIILIVEPIFRFVFKVLPLKHLLVALQTRLERRPKETPSNASDIPSKKIEKVFSDFKNTEEFVNFWGFPYEAHFVTTQDGYILGLHRIPGARVQRKGDKPFDSTKKPAVLLWHGFLMCSEVWVCSPDPKLSLAFTLAQAGYDVWLGNTRGNKYSCKHRDLKPFDEKFWDFSFDEFAAYDVPDSVDYILNSTGQSNLTYIAFSQGTAQGFASLSSNIQLNKKVNLFIALAPVTKPVGLENQGFNALVKTSPEIIYLLFGRRSLLSSIIFWQSIVPNQTWSQMIDACIWYIFDWNSNFVMYKDIAYKHLYSYSSVKCVVHWFQVISCERFQMYDDSPTFIPNSDGHIVPNFPTTNITTPIALFYGKKDTLPDMDYILETSPDPVLCMEVEEYEHLHFLWGKGLDTVVYPAILGLLSEYNDNWSDLGDDIQGSKEVFRTVPWISQGMIKRSRMATGGHDYIIRRSILSIEEQEIENRKDQN